MHGRNGEGRLALRAANLADVKAVGTEPFVSGVVVTLSTLCRAFERGPGNLVTLPLALQVVCHRQRLRVKRAGCVRLRCRRRHLSMFALQSKQILHVCVE